MAHPGTQRRGLKVAYARNHRALDGMSPECAVKYYQYITGTYEQRFGDSGLPEILVHSMSLQRFAGWQECINGVIYGELCCGKILAESRDVFLDVIDQLQRIRSQVQFLVASKCRCSRNRATAACLSSTRQFCAQRKL